MLTGYLFISLIYASGTIGLPDSFIRNKKVIFIGEESHKDNFSIVKETHIFDQILKENKNVAIVMEMFPVEDQYFLDQYLDGKINMKTFIKQTEFYNKFGQDFFGTVYDFSKYGNILKWAKKNRARVFAGDLNYNESRDKLEKISNDLFAQEKNLCLASAQDEKELNNLGFFELNFFRDFIMSEKIREIFLDKNYIIVSYSALLHAKIMQVFLSDILDINNSLEIVWGRYIFEPKYRYDHLFNIHTFQIGSTIDIYLGDRWRETLRCYSDFFISKRKLIKTTLEKYN